MSRIAVIGLGSIGNRHVDQLLALGCEDLMGYDVNPDQYEGRLPVVDNFTALLDWDPEYAIVATPPTLHFAQAHELLDTGCNVLVEKPMCLLAADAAQLCAVARKRNVVLGVGYMERAHPTIRMLKGLAGEDTPPAEAIVDLQWRATQKSYSWPGELWESSHALDTALYLFGEIVEADLQELGPHRAILFLRHMSGPLVYVTTHSDRDPSRSVSLGYGDARRMRKEVYGAPHEWDQCYKDELDAFLKHQPLCTGEEGAAVVRLIEALHNQKGGTS